MPLQPRPTASTGMYFSCAQDPQFDPQFETECPLSREEIQNLSFPVVIQVNHGKAKYTGLNFMRSRTPTVYDGYYLLSHVLHGTRVRYTEAIGEYQNSGNPFYQEDVSENPRYINIPNVNSFSIQDLTPIVLETESLESPANRHAVVLAKLQNRDAVSSPKTGFAPNQYQSSIAEEGIENPVWYYDHVQETRVVVGMYHALRLFGSYSVKTFPIPITADRDAMKFRIHSICAVRKSLRDYDTYYDNATLIARLTGEYPQHTHYRVFVGSRRQHELVPISVKAFVEQNRPDTPGSLQYVPQAYHLEKFAYVDGVVIGRYNRPELYATRHSLTYICGQLQELLGRFIPGVEDPELLVRYSPTSARYPCFFVSEQILSLDPATRKRFVMHASNDIFKSCVGLFSIV